MSLKTIRERLEAMVYIEASYDKEGIPTSDWSVKDDLELLLAVAEEVKAWEDVLPERMKELLAKLEEAP